MRGEGVCMVWVCAWWVCVHGEGVCMHGEVVCGCSIEIQILYKNG